jgi:hypothetical protein
MKDKCCTSEKNCDKFAFDLQELKNDCNVLFEGYGHETNKKGDIIDKNTLCHIIREKYIEISNKRDKYNDNTPIHVPFTYDIPSTSPFIYNIKSSPIIDNIPKLNPIIDKKPKNPHLEEENLFLEKKNL